MYFELFRIFVKVFQVDRPVISVVMGSSSDWHIMQHAANILKKFSIPHETIIVSAHRTPDRMFDYAETARDRGIKCIIAGAGGAAHLPGMIAAKTTLPVLGVPVTSKHLQGIDSLLSIVQMPKGIPVATFAIGEAGAVNAALFAVAMLAGKDTVLAEKLDQFRKDQADSVAAMTLPESCI
ncbi:5-(carboxyamino)imidazole ribonucleotide mutase [Nitrosomonas eutropha]|uniref:N5-carboxyaminoimidazole ribonucleotide mutase n=2 Tax=Nitrosomonas eutropha TaxID=916 RepID=A0ABX5M992_9PROT|nr:5-(carboxyamino)imidazole ribonucleotide mutase [Nitrosomonas eutropha]SCX08587.1 5-(carboxyamino)imidazole ribonucleotide mutase [Nitrosomonas eutropha]SEI37322.1 5-(carboxyamino)imidazole ribonucleotide mutase [Nitrosomonas eutropha]